MKRKISAFSLLALFGLLHLSGCSDSAPFQEAAERAEIEALMWRYVRALDSLDEEAYVTVFTEDGSFGSGATAAKGHDALRQMVIGVKEGRAQREAEGAPPSPPMYHVIANSRIEFIDNSHARFHSYWMTVFGPGDQDDSPRIAAIGRGIDELVKVEGQWLIQSRNVSPQD